MGGGGEVGRWLAHASPAEGDVCHVVEAACTVPQVLDEAGSQVADAGQALDRVVAADNLRRVTTTNASNRQPLANTLQDSTCAFKAAVHR